mmetsp:Transcript_32791/g.32014  ORF Transcript_32791/g.32014 Transcript_32791/m.32014 type:complete len:159 (-) Transcript_32791:329-805(-)
MDIFYLPHLVERVGGDVKKFFGQEVKQQLPYDELKDVYKALQRVPILDVKYSVVPINDRNEILENEKLEEGGEGMIIINLKRLNKGQRQTVLISNFPKLKEAAWFIVVSNPKQNDVLATKRVTFNRFATKNLCIALPRDFLEEKLELTIMCDSYIGLD